MPTLVVGTRGSALALAQTNWVCDRLSLAHPGVSIQIETILTQGDRSQAAETPLGSYGRKGVFATELEAALLSGDIDAAVHSMKDLASDLPEGLCIGAVPVREDARDVVVGARLADLSAGARVGTGSVRRRALLAEAWPHLAADEIRGNVDTRIRKLREGRYDAIILAAAGISRLGRSAEIDEYLDAATFVPDPGQGALAIECRASDSGVRAWLSAIADPVATATARAERAFLQALGGGCQTPLGAWARVDGETLILLAMVADNDGCVRRIEQSAAISDAEAIGRSAARALGGLE
ncbi:MAG: hydroxymethylbilane synthase [Capsulimonadaceae bacterium]|nr:hydroxymethylbilane synthase [Capsulimonadaceae bacterium]